MSLGKLTVCSMHRRELIRRSRIGLCLLAFGTSGVALLAEQKQPEQKAPEASSDDDKVDEPVYDVGGDVKPPRVVHRVMPEFTPKSREQHIEGSVVLTTVVTSKGEPRRIRVQKSLERSLDEKAVEALRQWTFAPGQKEDKAVATRVSIEIRFNVL